MSIPFSGTLKRSAGVISAISKQLKSVTLKPAKKIVVKFDPFHEKVAATRDFLYHLSSPKILETNISCALKAEVICDRSDPIIEITLKDGEKVILKSANLSTLELIQLYNKHITPLAPVEEVAAPVKTKASRAAPSKKR